MIFFPTFLRKLWRASVMAGDPIISCLSCRVSHKLPRDIAQRVASEFGFIERHAGHNFTWGSIYGFTENSDVKLALQSVQTMTVTNLHSLASSATGGWQGAVVDNTSNLYLDDLWQVVLDFGNSAPANSKAAVVFAYGGIESGVYSNPASGSEGSITLVDFTTTPQNLRWIGTIPYTTQDETAESSPFSVAPAFGGILPPFYGPVLMNHSGASLAASGNTFKRRGIYHTVI